MAKKKDTIEETVDNLIDPGISFLPVRILATGESGHVVKPENIDGQFLVNSAGNTTLTLTTGNNSFTHSLGREPIGIQVVRKDAAEHIYEGTNWDVVNADIAVSGDVNAIIFIF